MNRGPRWSETTAVFGGAFDPPHLGHRDAVRGLFTDPGIARVWIVPTGEPALKSARSPILHRLAMARLAFSSSAMGGAGPVEVLDLEVNRSLAHPGQKSYAYDTLRELRQSAPRLAFVIGTDQLRDLHLWHRFPDLLTLCDWIVLERQGEEPGIGREILRLWAGSGLAKPETTSSALWRLPSRIAETWLQIVRTPARAISSTQIREALAKKQETPVGFLSTGVEEYLKRQMLYGTQART